MSWFSSLSPVRRFERQYAEYLISRFQSAPLPGNTRIDLLREFVPIRGLQNAIAAAGDQPVLMVGEPGAGKSTALAYIALLHARALLARSAAARIPIFISGRELVPREIPRLFDVSSTVLGDVLAAQCPTGYFVDVVRAKRAIVLVDDLDALPENSSASLVREFPGIPILATASASISGTLEFRIPPLRDSEIERFARGWDAKNASAFLTCLKTSRVPRSLTGNRLSLALLTRIWQPDQALPARRTELFDIYTRTVLGGTGEIERELEQVALARLRGRPPSNGVLKAHGFMRAGKNHTAEFVHELWGAYFAARGLKQETNLSRLRESLADRRAQQALVFYGGWGDASDLVESLVARGDWYQAGRVLANAQQVRAEVRETITRELMRKAWDGDQRATAVLSEMESEAAVDELAERLRDRDPQTRAHAAGILGQLSLDRAVDFLLPQLRDADPGVRDSVAIALGMARTDRVIEPLLVVLRGDSRAGHVDSRLRAAAAQALGMIGSDRAVPALTVDMQHGEPDVQAAAAQALQRISSPLREETRR